LRFCDVTLDDAEAGAAGFYARCGFAQCGRVTYKGDPLVY